MDVLNLLKFFVPIMTGFASTIQMHMGYYNLLLRCLFLRKRNRGRLISSKNLILRRKMRKHTPRKFWIRPERTNSWWQNLRNGKTVGNEWRENFRMTKPTFDKLCDLVAPFISSQITNMRQPLSVQTQLALNLYYLSDGGRMRKTANAFGCGLCVIPLANLFITLCYKLRPDFRKTDNTDRQKSFSANAEVWWLRYLIFGGKLLRSGFKTIGIAEEAERCVFVWTESKSENGVVWTEWKTHTVLPLESGVRWKRYRVNKAYVSAWKFLSLAICATEVDF